MVLALETKFSKVCVTRNATQDARSTPACSLSVGLVLHARLAGSCYSSVDSRAATARRVFAGPLVLVASLALAGSRAQKAELDLSMSDADDLLPWDEEPNAFTAAALAAVRDNSKWRERKAALKLQALQRSRTQRRSYERQKASAKQIREPFARELMSHCHEYDVSERSISHGTCRGARSQPPTTVSSLGSHAASAFAWPTPRTAFEPGCGLPAE